MGAILPLCPRGWGNSLGATGGAPPTRPYLCHVGVYGNAPVCAGLGWWATEGGTSHEWSHRRGRGWVTGRSRARRPRIGGGSDLGMGPNGLGIGAHLGTGVDVADTWGPRALAYLTACPRDMLSGHGVILVYWDAIKWLMCNCAANFLRQKSVHQPIKAIAVLL